MIVHLSTLLFPDTPENRNTLSNLSTLVVLCILVVPRMRLNLGTLLVPRIHVSLHKNVVAEGLRQSLHPKSNLD